ncbi:MAG: hypothetical protein APR63_14845 [Desulfuromonas sp. SDB]|nr:MAG: hypothetical protein APR63_14845 [Desulfuromonas sp. SDB]
MKYTVIFMIILIFTSFTISAEAFRCKNEPIGRWDTKDKVLKYCGKPIKTGHKKVFYKGTYVYAETFYYNCGDNDFIYAVFFYDNIVIKEEPKERGSGVGQCK